jgi:D-alanyl-D-alanine carboxypeptidase/D-alanyl-D-alanine-endopeptidase (penicillin-binding protein 4)
MEEKGQSDMNGWSRRKVLAGLTAIVPATAMANPIDRSLRPNLRPEDWPPPQRPVSRPDLADYVQRYAPSGQHTLSVVDLRSGQTIEAMGATTQLPPASVTKAVTAFYALAVLGSEFAFETRLIADGSITDGILDGDLILQGSGDPNLKPTTLRPWQRRCGRPEFGRSPGAYCLRPMRCRMCSKLNQRKRIT